MTISTSALSKFSTSWRAGARDAVGEGVSTSVAASAGRPAVGGVGAAAGGAGAGEDGGTGRSGGAGGRGVGAGSLVISIRGRADSDWPAVVGAPDGRAAELQPSASARTRNQHAARLPALIAARLPWRVQMARPRRPGRWAAGSPDSPRRSPSERQPAPTQPAAARQLSRPAGASMDRAGAPRGGRGLGR